jgi:hypothetical protein
VESLVSMLHNLLPLHLDILVHDTLYSTLLKEETRMSIFILFSFFYLLLAAQSIYAMDGENPSSKRKTPRRFFLSELPKETEMLNKQKTYTSSTGPLDKKKQEETSHKTQDQQQFLSAVVNRKEEFTTSVSLILQEQPKPKHAFFSLSSARQKGSLPARTSQSHSPRHSPRDDSPRKIQIKQQTDDDYLVKSVQKGKIDIIKAFLDEETNDPNQQSIGPKNTLLHLAVLYDKKHPGKDISMLFLTNPRVNTLIKNTYNCTPFQCIAKEEMVIHIRLYEVLKQRATLDQIVNAMIVTDLQVIQNSDSKETALAKLRLSITTIKEKISNLLGTIPNIAPRYANITFIFSLIQSRIQYTFPTLAMFIRNRKINMNAQDDWDNSCLHHAAYLRNKDLLLILLKNPMINSLIKNSENLYAHQLIPTTEKISSELRLLLFARNSLDSWIEEQRPHFSAAHLKIRRAIKLEDPEFQIIVKKIKDKSKQIEKAQKDKDVHDRELPQETIYPNYATNQFLLDRFNALEPKNNYDILDEILVGLDSSSFCEDHHKIL